MEFSKQIQVDFPELFKNPICGVSIQPGWEKLILKLCTNIEEIRKVSGIGINVAQVKEKFGGLRFYVEYKQIPKKSKWARNACNALISGAESKSFHTCAVCGEWGQQRNTGWVQTLCRKHYLEVCEEKGLDVYPDYEVGIRDIMQAMQEYKKELNNGRIPRLRIYSDGSGSVGHGNDAKNEHSFTDFEAHNVYAWLRDKNRKYDD
jgi:hypothetical protein